jgi:tetratricopeptide (TPR) repeat protein
VPARLEEPIAGFSRPVPETRSPYYRCLTRLLDPTFDARRRLLYSMPEPRASQCVPHRRVTATALSRNGDMTTSELHPIPGTSRDHVRKWRSRTWVAVTGLAIASMVGAIVWSRPRASAQRLWDQAQNALKAGDLATAEARLVSISRLRAPTSFDLSLKAQIAAANGRPDEALAALARIPEGDRLAGQAFLMAGRIERRRNHIRAAEAQFRNALAAETGLIGARKELIFILGMQLRRREVDEEFKSLSRLTPLSHHELVTWGLTHFSVWVENSADQLEAFIQADPEDRYSRLSLATVFLRTLGMERRVDETLEPLPRSDPAAAALRIELRLNQGRIDEAMALLEDAPDDDPLLARIRGRVALMRHDYEAAIRHFKAAWTEEPYDRVSLTDLGKALALFGDTATAETFLARGRRLDDVYNLFNWVKRSDQPNQPSDLTRFGLTCEAARLADEARGWYLLAIGRDPLDSEAQRGLQRLRGAQRSLMPPDSSDLRDRGL